jgi:prolyl-tRNA synthetase
MTHGDDNGIRIPPLLAPIEIVVVPIYKTDEERSQVLEAAKKVIASLHEWERRRPGALRVHLDARDGVKPGAKYYEWELKGVPIRLELGPKDIAKNQVVLVRRDTREKKPASLNTLGEDVAELLIRIQEDMLIVARDRREANSIRERISYDKFRQIMEGEGGGAFVYAGWCGSPECEKAVKDETKATIRVLPDEEFRSADPPTHCLKCGAAASAEALWAKAY